jgi:hypothetical protein
MTDECARLASAVRGGVTCRRCLCQPCGRRCGTLIRTHAARRANYQLQACIHTRTRSTGTGAAPTCMVHSQYVYVSSTSSLVIGRSLPFLLAGSPTQATGTGRDATRRDPNVRTPGRPGAYVAGSRRCGCCCMMPLLGAAPLFGRGPSVERTHARTQLALSRSPPPPPLPPSSPALPSHTGMQHRPVLCCVMQHQHACLSLGARTTYDSSSGTKLACMHV